MTNINLLLILSCLASFTLAWGGAVYEITPADDTSEILQEGAMVFVLYEDKKHEHSQ